MKKIIYITGTRAEYGAMSALLRALDGVFDFSLIVTGMHLSRTQGYTFDEVQKDRFHIAGVVDGHVEEISMAESLGYEIAGITKILLKEKPDIVLVAGDRDEALAGAAAAAHLSIPLAHISGGDITMGGAIDDRIRHAITRFADIHFAESDQSAANLILMGENKELVFSIGAVGADMSVDEAAQAAVADKYSLDRNKSILIIGQHSVTANADEAGVQMYETLEALRELQIQAVLIYPNSDTGSDAMIEEIEKRKTEPYLRIVRNVPRDEYVALMSIADVIVGNSSGALIEAPSFALPAVNIGGRQEGRERAKNVIDVQHNKKEIVAGVQRALSKEFTNSLIGMQNPYAKGDAVEKIVSILQALDVSPNILRMKTVMPHD